MVSFTAVRVITALVLIAAASFAQIADERTTVVAPLPDEDILHPCEYRLQLPESTGEVRAVWTIFDRGQDYLRWYQDRQVRAFARKHRLALVLAMHCRSKEREDMMVHPAKGAGRALFTALDQFAVSEHRPELKKAPLIAMGWSGAGSLAARLAGYRPDRYLARIAYAPGHYEKYFDKGAPWTFIVQNRTPHCCLQNAQALILDWLHAILTTPPKSWGKGTQGYLTVEFSPVTDERKRPVFNATSARIDEQSRKPASQELPAGWLPSSVFAEVWLTFCEASRSCRYLEAVVPA